LSINSEEGGGGREPVMANCGFGAKTINRGASAGKKWSTTSGKRGTHSQPNGKVFVFVPKNG